MFALQASHSVTFPTFDPHVTKETSQHKHKWKSSIRCFRSGDNSLPKSFVYFKGDTNTGTWHARISPF